MRTWDAGNSHDAFLGIIDTACCCANKLGVESSRNFRACPYDLCIIFVDAVVYA